MVLDRLRLLVVASGTENDVYMDHNHNNMDGGSDSCNHLQLMHSNTVEMTMLIFEKK